ncbi:phosphate signaling complex protein PhoU [bacterium]|nr:phosphate signaling complex protein PhoU [bacterium]
MTTQLRKEIDHLQKQILNVGALAEESVQRAVRSFMTNDTALAKQVIEDDNEIDHAEVEVEEECLKVLALHQPVAVDLRLIIAVLKINNDLERIGDLAVNIAQKTLHLHDFPPVQPPDKIEIMAKQSQEMLKMSIDSLVSSNSQTALKVCELDDIVDDLNREIFFSQRELMSSDPSRLEGYVEHIGVSRNLERIADLATNIAEDVYYLVEGEIIRHKHKMDY